MNLSFMLPMLLMGIRDIGAGFTEIKTALQGFNLVQSATNTILALTETLHKKNISTKVTEIATTAGLSVTEENLAKATALVAAGKEASIPAALAKISAETGELIVTESLSTAIKGLIAELGALIVAKMAFLGPAAAVIALIAGLGIAAGASAEQYRQYKQQVDENLTASNQLVDSLKQQKTAYDESYNTFLKTGQVTEDLKKNSLEMADALDISGARAAVARGQFHELNKQIQELTNSQLAYNSALAAQKEEILAKEIGIKPTMSDMTTVGENGYLINEPTTANAENVLGQVLDKQKK